MAFFSPKRGATGSARPKTTKLPPPTASEDDEDTISSSTISLQLESTVTSSVRPENRQNNAVALPIKTPLSPKRTNLRKRHSSAEDETESLVRILCLKFSLNPLRFHLTRQTYANKSKCQIASFFKTVNLII